MLIHNTDKMQQLNIVDLIEKNPITKLSNVYNSKFLTKIKDNFSGFEQQLFVGSFYCYLNYDKNIDFIVDLDNVWGWLGFKQKIDCKRILEKIFKINIDYKFASEDKINQSEKADKQEIWGGHNKQKIFLTVKCFKSLCMKAQTKKASEIHDYYLKLEELLHEIVEEETDELRQQLEQKDNIILEITQNSEKEKEILLKTSKKEKQKAVEQAIIVQFPVNTECIYFGTIDNTNEANEKLVKFGHTNDLATRILDHRKKYDNFNLVNAFRVQNKVEIENLIKTSPKIKRHIRTMEINGKNKTEIIAYDATNFTLERLSRYIKDIIHSKTYSIDNFNRIIKENEELHNENRNLKQQLEEQAQQIKSQAVEIINLKDKMESQYTILETVQQENESVYQNILLPEDEVHNKFNDFINSVCIVRPDVEELSVNLEGRYRLWSQVKPTKEIFHALKHYLDTRFKPKRIDRNHGYLGVKLKEVEYIKTQNHSDVETFLFQVCKFSDNGKILNTVLLEEYQTWKRSVDRPVKNDETDLKELKTYLNASPYALKSPIWTDGTSGDGYYGISLKKINQPLKLISSTGKKVYKREATTHALLGTWDTIAKAADSENCSTAKMSRCVKNKTVIQDYYYTVDA
jgi:predicted nuclease with TOPRIM domain